MPRKHKDPIDVTVSQMKKRSEVKPSRTPSGQQYIPTGSTLLNLALSDRWDGGWPCGKISNLIGDSSSGKTFIAMTGFAEMTAAPQFSKYRLINDDVEAANEFNMEKLFGEQTASRVEPPCQKEGQECSDTIQQFHAHVLDALDKGRPFFYLLDSFDALTSDEELTRAEELAKATREGKIHSKGSYGMEKAKKAGEILRQIKSRMANTASSLVIISQTRDNIDPMSFSKKTRSGGRALKFYSTHEIWTAVGGMIKRKNMPVGVLCKVKVSKNKITGKVREITIPIYYDYGLDDLESCIDWLVANDFWQMKGATIDAADFGEKGTKAKLIRWIEENGMEKDLSKLVGKYWNDFEDSLKVSRKPKYT